MRAEQVTGPLADHGEGPVWSAAWHGLRWVDMLRGDLLTYNPHTGEVARRHVAAMATIVRPRRKGGLVVATDRSILVSPSDDGPFTCLLTGWQESDIRINDGSCDPDGNLWFGSMAHDAAPGRGRLYRLAPDGSLDVVLAAVTVSNGLDWSPDGTRAYYVDSATGQVDALTLHGPRIAQRRRLVTIAPQAAPDGLCVDAAGNIWVALWGGGAVHCYTPDGTLANVVNVPVRHPTACTFGGTDAQDLYITTSRRGATGATEAAAGALFIARDAGTGQPVRPFAG